MGVTGGYPSAFTVATETWLQLLFASSTTRRIMSDFSELSYYSFTMHNVMTFIALMEPRYLILQCLEARVSFH